MVKRKRKNTRTREFIWSLSARRFDSTKFFAEILGLLDGSEVVYVEGTSVSKEAEKLYTTHKSTGAYLPGKGTIWPSSKTFSCNATPLFFEELEKLTENHAEPELFDHFHIYKDQHPFLEWWDAFSDPIVVCGTVSESDVYNFAATMGLKVEKLQVPEG